MKLKLLLLSLLLSLCTQASAEWFLRGTYNAWAATQMVSAGAGTNTMQLNAVVFAAAGNVKFDRFGDWAESYGAGGLNGSNIAVAVGTWDIKFFTDTKTWSITATPTAVSYHVRGTHNGWAEGVLMNRVGTSSIYESCIQFISGDANGGPRFKIDPNGGWGDGIPATDFTVAAGWVKISFNSSSQAISTQQNMAANCGLTSSSSLQASSTVSSTPSSTASSSLAISSAVSSTAASSAPSSIYHLRGTFNNWAEGTLMTRVGTTSNYEYCANFSGSNPRFKIDPNGGWGDGIPAADFVVSVGWVKINFNSGNNTISVLQNLAANCITASSSSAISSSSTVSSTAPSSIYHLRGTFNSWAEGTLMTRVGSTDTYEKCINFIAGDSNGGPRFKIDPNGGWGDAVPTADFVVTVGWVKITFNSVSKAISVQQNLAAECGLTSASSSSTASATSSSSVSMSSFNGTLNLSINNSSGRAFINENVNLTANVSGGSGWSYEWKLIEDSTYNRKDIYDLSWNSTWMDFGCQAANFGQRITGKLYPPVPGNYRFAVASAKMHELRISKNGVSQLISSSVQAVGTADYFVNNSQGSAPIELSENGHPFEFLYINDSGSGHFSILWQKPGSGSWEEVPESAFSKPNESSVTGKLQQETFNQTFSSFNQLTTLPSFVNSRSNAANSLLSGQTINFTPTQHTTYKFEVTATSGAQVVKNTISFFAEGRLASEDSANASSVWLKSGMSGSTQMRIAAASDGSATGNVLEISETQSGSFAEWNTALYLQPYTAYEVRARVRLLNAPNNIQIPSGMGDSLLWKLPRLRVGVHGNASEQGIDPLNPGQWRDVKVDFVVPYDGLVDLHAHMGEYSGTFQIDNIRIEKLTGDTVTRFEYPNLAINLYNDIVTRTGGIEPTRRYIERLSKITENMRELSGNSFLVQCKKQNIWIPKNWSVFALGTNGGSMILKTPDLLTNSFLQDVWASENVVGGVMIHEIEHSFGFPGIAFGAHIPELMQAYAMEKNNLLRTEGNDFIDAEEWVVRKRANNPICGGGAEALLPKLFEFQELLPASSKWQPFKQIMHDRWLPYKTQTEGRQWPLSSEYDQYRKWWSELESYTGIDGWNLLHTPAEQASIQTMYQRRATPVQANIDPASLSQSQQTLFLNQASRVATQIGYGDIDIGAMVDVNSQCRVNSIYAHAPSVLSYNLNKKWLTLNTTALIKDNSVAGLVSARVLGDGVELYRSANFTAQTSPVTSGTIDISNVNLLTLQFSDEGSNNSDWSVWADPEIARGQLAATQFASTGKAIKHSSGKCVQPASGGVPAMNEVAVLGDDCSSSNAKFKHLASGALLHISSGSCLHPSGGSATPGNGTQWVFFPYCLADAPIVYDHTQGNLKHRSGNSCLQPNGGSLTPAAGTPLVFNSNCTGAQSQFSFE